MKEKVQCVLWFRDTRTAITVQRNFRKKSWRAPSLFSMSNVSKTGKRIQDNGRAGDRKTMGRPSLRGAYPTTTPVDDLHSLTSRIADAIESVPREMLQNTWRGCGYRLDIFRATKEAHVKVY